MPQNLEQIKLLMEKQIAKREFENAIAETQIEIREQTLRNISWELHDNIGQLLTLAKIQLHQLGSMNYCLCTPCEVLICYIHEINKYTEEKES